MTVALHFSPLIAPWALWLFAGFSAVVVLYGFAARATGTWARTLALAAMLFVLAHPLIVHERHEPLADIAVIITDKSQSMALGTRAKERDAAVAALRKKLMSMGNLEIREASVTTSTTAEDDGTQLFAALNSVLADIPQGRVAGAIAVTDGEVHDAPTPAKLLLHAPLHALIAGRHDERDRKLTIVSASRFAIVGQQAQLVVRVDDLGSNVGGSANVTLRIDGMFAGLHNVPIGANSEIKVPLAHGGENVIEVEAAPGPAELTLENNRAVVAITGVRDRLRVLLVSGQPHAGERVWRNLLKADPSVDLVHFTILRPPEKQDATPTDQLSLIAFPTRELFLEKLDQFDLVIFDRYGQQGILPLGYFENIAGYVDNGGALLVAAGPEFTGDGSIYRTPLSSVLPAQPTGDILAQPFKPLVTSLGLAHPVTRALAGANDGANPPSWGRWFRMIGATAISGQTVMAGPGNRPLLVLDRIGKGRVAEFLSDQAWLWARGFEGGGPEAELLRRLAHWLMKEPELEEERLTASIAGGTISVERRTMAATAAPATITTPSGKTSQVQLAKTAPGVFAAKAKAGELGLYRLTDGTLSAVAAAGPLNPKEVADMRATDKILKPLTDASGGSVHWIEDGGVPSVKRVGPRERASGSDWIGLRSNGAYRVTSVEETALLPPWAALLLVLGLLLFAWRMEGR